MNGIYFHFKDNAFFDRPFRYLFLAFCLSLRYFGSLSKQNLILKLMNDWHLFSYISYNFAYLTEMKSLFIFFTLLRVSLLLDWYEKSTKHRPTYQELFHPPIL